MLLFDIESIFSSEYISGVLSGLTVAAAIAVFVWIRKKAVDGIKQSKFPEAFKRGIRIRLGRSNANDVIYIKSKQQRHIPLSRHESRELKKWNDAMAEAFKSVDFVKIRKDIGRSIQEINKRYENLESKGKRNS